MEHAPPNIPKGHAEMKLPANPDYWLTTAAIALFLLAFLVGLAIAQVMW